MDIRYLGPLEIIDAGRPLPLGGPKQRLVLAHLLVEAERTVPVERLIDRVWAQDPPAAARTSLHSYVSNLRRLVGSERIVSRGQGYAFDVDGTRIDRLEFDDLVARGRRLLTTDPPAASQLLRRALELWRGPAFADLSEERSLSGEIARLNDLRLAALDDRLTADLASGRDRELVSELRALTHANPLHERFWAHLMVALYRSGRQGDALEVFTEARRVLATELGVDPSPELVRLQRQILQHDDVLDAGAPVLRGYHLLERIGSGRSAIVWRARQPGIERLVALKVVRAQLANSPAFIRGFEAHAQAVARVEHPHVVPLYDVWREPDGAFLAMRYLSGGDVASLIGAAQPPTPVAALRIIEQAAAGVGAAHRQGIVHGNLAPSNILLDRDGAAYVSDFAMPDGGSATTAPHAAPECRQGASPTPAADVYALGVMLRQLAPSDAGPVADIAARATSAKAAGRYRDAVAFVAALRTAAPAVAARDGARPTIGHDDSDGPVRNPYKGLRAFVEGDAPDFFGREAFVRRLVARHGEHGAGRFIAVVGPSGSGKSSVARAGLIPALRAGALDGSSDWYIAQMLPGADPFTELATALRPLAVDVPPDLAAALERGDALDTALAQILPDDNTLVLLIDQFEELFTQFADDDRRDRFLRLISRAASDPDGRIRVVITLRADYYDRPLREPAIADLVRQGTEAVVPLTAAELERAVTGPADRVGVTVERDLVAQVVADVAAEPAGLPLLQYALTEVFEQRVDGRLTLEAYRQAGGIAGALARRADGELSRLPPAGQESARQLFLRLVTPGHGAEPEADGTEYGGDGAPGRSAHSGEGDTRRRVPVAAVEALAPEHLPAVIAAFGAARLLTFDRDPRTREPTVEVAHEALLGEWRRLATWIDAARDDLQVRQRLTASAADWVAAGRDASYLARGARLDRYERWQLESGLTPTAQEQAFIEASLVAREQQRDAEAQRVARERDLERRSVRRLRALTGVLGAAALIAAALTIFAVTQARRAGDQAQVATARELAAAAAANVDIDPERSILLAREAAQRTRAADGSIQPEVASVLHRAVGASRIQLSVDDVGGYVDWSPDGDTFVTEGPEESGIIDLRDAATGESVRSWTGHDADINSVMFGPDGELLVAGDDAGTLSVWEASTGARVASVTSPAGGTVWRAAISPDGALAAGAWEDEGIVRLIDIAAGDVVHEIAVEWANTVAFAPDGDRLAVAEGPPVEGAGDVFVFDVATGETVLTIPDVAEGLQAVSWSPDGTTLAVASFSSDILLYDAESGDLRSTLTGHTATVTDLDWSTDGSKLVSASLDGTAKVWEVIPGGGREIASLSSLDTAGLMYSATFSPDGTHVLGADPGGLTTAIWDIGDTASAEGAVIPTYAGEPQDHIAARTGFLPDGALAVLDPDGGIGMWDIASGKRLRTIGAGAGPRDMLAIGDHGRWLASATRDGSVSMWAADTGEAIATVDTPGKIVTLAASADTPLVAVADGDGDGSGGAIRLYTRDGADRGMLAMPGRDIIDVALSPDGSRLAATSTTADRLTATRVDIWDTESRRIVHTVEAGIGGLDFDANGALLATGGAERGTAIWDVETGDEVRVLVGDVGAPLVTTFSDDGGRIATTTDDGSIRVWDTERGVELVTVQASGPAALDAAFSPDGSRLATAGDDGTVRVWLLDLDDLLALADDRVTRELTDEECRQYLHVDSCEAP